MTLVALDDFAGTGWGVACLKMGIREGGVEKMPEAIATRTANGMVTIGTDVWAHIKQQLATQGTPDYFGYSLYIGSPPCQTFSLAGSGSGRKALDEVIGLIDSRAYLDVDLLHEFGERHDPRTALVLAPLVRIVNDVPTYVVLEQVPPVLPVWERYAVELRKWGYSVWVGILNAEQYGVPQTRKRAVLIARADGIEAAPPKPTHSRYYPTNPARLDEGVLPWVSMAQALGWGEAGSSIAARAMRGAGQTERYGARPDRAGDTPSLTVRANGGGNASGGFIFVSNDKQPHSARRPVDAPAPTLTAGHDSGNRKWLRQSAHSQQNGPRDRPTAVPMQTVASDVAGFRYIDDDQVDQRSLDLYREVVPHPRDAVTSVRTSMGEPKVDGRNGTHELDPHNRPSHTVTTKADSWQVEQARTLVGHQSPDNGNPDVPNERQRRDDDLPAPTVTSGSRSALWEHGETGEAIKLDPNKPSMTVAADPRLTAREHHNHGEQSATSTRVTVAEAAALQSYPADFDWSPMVPVLRKGVDTGKLAPLSKTKAFLQIGNAVPPTLAEAILSVFPR